MNRQFLIERIEATKAQIIAYDNAITALAANPVQSYTLDTGQSRQTVTRFDLASLQRQLASLENKLATLCARLNGSGVFRGVPAW